MALLIIDISSTARHACPKVASGWAKDDRSAAGHILAAMIAYTLDNGDSTAVADGETFSGASAHQEHPTGCAIQHGIANNHLLVRLEAVMRVGHHDNLA